MPFLSLVEFSCRLFRVTNGIGIHHYNLLQLKCEPKNCGMEQRRLIAWMNNLYAWGVNEKDVSHQRQEWHNANPGEISNTCSHGKMTAVNIPYFLDRDTIFPHGSNLFIGLKWKSFRREVRTMNSLFNLQPQFSVQILHRKTSILWDLNPYFLWFWGNSANLLVLDT